MALALVEAGADTSARNNEGETFVKLATERGFVKTLAWLRAHGASG